MRKDELIDVCAFFDSIMVQVPGDQFFFGKSPQTLPGEQESLPIEPDPFPSEYKPMREQPKYIPGQPEIYPEKNPIYNGPRIDHNPLEEDLKTFLLSKSMITMHLSGSL